MPIYEYKCNKCGSTFEALIRGSEVPACPDCKSEEVGRLMSAPAAAHAQADTPCGSDCGGQHAHSCGCAGHCHCH